MVNLRMSEDIDLLAPERLQVQEWTLTQRGQRTLREAKQIVPEERSFTVNFDGLLRHVKWYGRFDSRLLRPRDWRDRVFLALLAFQPTGMRATPNLPINGSNSIIGTHSTPRRVDVRSGFFLCVVFLKVERIIAFTSPERSH